MDLVGILNYQRNDFGLLIFDSIVSLQLFVFVLICSSRTLVQVYIPYPILSNVYISLIRCVLIAVSFVCSGSDDAC
jgi:hypothetical protein